MYVCMYEMYYTLLALLSQCAMHILFLFGLELFKGRQLQGNYVYITDARVNSSMNIHTCGI